MVRANSQGELVSEITATAAANISAVMPYNEEEIQKADIMHMIARYSRIGQISYAIHMANKQLSQDTIDWLVSLGYLVCHQAPYQSSATHIQYYYTVYWAFPDDSLIPFAPGEKFSP